MREAQKSKTVEIQEQSGAKVSRPPGVPVRPGIWRGHPNPGAFKVGHDPRRNLENGPWSSNIRKSLEEACKAHTEDAIQFLTTTLNDPDAPLQSRMAAATELLNRGHGTPVSRTVVASIGEEKPVQSMTRDELMAAMSARYSTTATQVIEHDPETPDES